MRLPATLGHAVLEGRKTTHRIPAGRQPEPPHKPGDRIPLQFPQLVTDSFGQTVLDSQGEPIRTFAHPARLRITAISEQRLEDIDTPAARQEGFDNFGAFLDYWQETHGDLTDRRMASRVWVLHFKVELPDTIRLLARGGGYTTSPALALDEEPEAIDPRTIKALPASLLAQQRWSRAKLDEQHHRERMALEDRLTRARAELLAAGEDPEPYEESILRRIRAMENRARKAAA